MYNFDIRTNCHKFNFDKIYALFGVNYFSPEISVVKNLGHLEGLAVVVSAFVKVTVVGAL